MQLINSPIALAFCSVGFFTLTNAAIIPSRPFVPAEGKDQIYRRDASTQDTTVLRNGLYEMSE